MLPMPSRMLPIFRDVLNAPALVVRLDDNAETLPNYDSLAHIDIVTAIEKEYGISFGFSELVDLQSVGDMVALVERKTSAARTAVV